MDKPVISLANLTKRYQETTAVNDVSVTIKRGEVVGFVGPNGAGKTTTISLLLGFIHATKGEVHVLNTHITPQTAHRVHHKIGYIAGDMSLFDGLTGEQYLSFMAHRLGINQEVRTRLESRLSPQLNKKLKALSRGNKQKISLIAALQHDPELIVMDEPTSGLDPLMQETFLTLIREEASRGATVFMSSHILSEVAAVCSRVLFMKKGRIVSDQSVAAIEKTAGKLIHITGSESELKLIKTTAPKEAHTIHQTDTQLTLRFDNDVHQALRWLSMKKFHDLTIVDRQLDDLFLDLYKDEEPKK